MINDDLRIKGERLTSFPKQTKKIPAMHELLDSPAMGYLTKRVNFQCIMDIFAQTLEHRGND